MLLSRSTDPWGNVCHESKNEWNLLRCYENCKKYLNKIPGASVSVILGKKRLRCLQENFGCLEEKQQLCALTPNPELVGLLRSQLSLAFSQGHGCFWVHILRGAERFANLSQLQGLAECCKEIMSQAKNIYCILRVFFVLLVWYEMKFGGAA